MQPPPPPLPPSLLFKWLTPNASQKNISITIEKIYLGLDDDDDKSSKDNNYHIPTVTISEKIYREIIKYLNINNIIHNANTNTKDAHFKHLKFNKKTRTLKKVEKKNLLRFSLTICPVCQYSTCLECTKSQYKKYLNSYHQHFKNFKKKPLSSLKTPTMGKGVDYPRYIKCFNCKNIFSTRKTNYKLFKCLGFQCKFCQKKYDALYKEFLTFYYGYTDHNDLNYHYPLRNILNKHFGDVITLSKKKKIQYIYERYFSLAAKKALNFNYQTLYYHLKVKRENNNKLIIIPPLAFFANMNKPASFFINLLEDENAKDCHLDVKSQYGSVNSRSQGGKNSIFRNICLNKRYTGSARAVIVPRQCLLPHECILPAAIYKALNCPKHVLLHRYPTLDIRSMTYHEVVKVWQFPSIAISTAIVSGNNADFDGDCVHIIPATNIMTQAELIYLCHPMRNMIVQNQLRLNFDHDEIETIFSHFGLNRERIHRLIYDAVLNYGDEEGYKLFCSLKRYCEWTWTFLGVATVTFNDFLEIIKANDRNDDYYQFVNNIFPQLISANNGVKKMIESGASRFSIDHLWQTFGYINEEAKDRGGFLGGMSKKSFIQMARLSRLAMIKDVSYYGYSQIKLAHCTKSILLHYDQRLYTTDGILVATNVKDVYSSS